MLTIYLLFQETEARLLEVQLRQDLQDVPGLDVEANPDQHLHPGFQILHIYQINIIEWAVSFRLTLML
jgi:hypothetical protein